MIKKRAEKFLINKLVPLDVLIGDKSHLNISQITKISIFSLLLMNSWLPLPWQPLKVPKQYINEVPQWRASI